MKIFVKNDSKKKYYNNVINRLNNYKNVIEKLQNALKILQKSYKVVISISLWALDRCLPDRCGRMPSVASRVSIYV